jgi:hypothetical protein
MRLSHEKREMNLPTSWGWVAMPILAAVGSIGATMLVSTFIGVIRFEQIGFQLGARIMIGMSILWTLYFYMVRRQWIEKAILWRWGIDQSELPSYYPS